MGLTITNLREQKIQVNLSAEFGKSQLVISKFRFLWIQPKHAKTKSLGILIKIHKVYLLKKMKRNKNQQTMSPNPQKKDLSPHSP